MTLHRRGDPIAGVIVEAAPYLAVGIAVSPLLLLVPSSSSLTIRFVAHLAGLVTLGLLLSLRIAPRLVDPFFTRRGWRDRWETVATGVVLVVVVTGVVGLVTLASSAALRFDPSLQFLQLLSALDIAWAGAAIVIGARHLRGRGLSAFAGVALGAACVASIWNYLRVVGFTPEGGWLVDGSRLMTLVIPFDTVAGIVAGTVLFASALRVSADRAGQ